jgi:hypothetical protein
MPLLVGRACLPVVVACALSAALCFGQSTTSAAKDDSNDPSLSGRPRSGSCVTVAEAALRPNAELCVSAHVYDVVELPDGTRFLDVCPPAEPDTTCGFTIVSQPADRAEVGDLSKFRNKDVHIRGVVRVTHGRMGLTVSHARQFRGGAEKFRPNPLLVRGFDGQSTRMPVRDPNLASSGRHRAFMDNREQEAVPGR